MDKFLKNLGLELKTENEARMMSPLVLAYIGDAVYEVYIRTFILHSYKGKVHDYHKISTKFVKASAQAKIIHTIMDELSEAEVRMVKRGRNQKSATVPKNADLTDYKYATGFETLIGYLYLTNNQERLSEIIEKAINIIQKDV